MKVSKTVSIDLNLLQRVLEENPNFSKAVTEALENWLNFKQETERGNSVHFSNTFNTKIPPKIIWQLMTFDGIVKWINMLKKVEYLTEHTSGLGTKCILYGEIDDIKASTVAEITEYKEYERMVIRSQGEFRMFVSASLYSKGPTTNVNVVVVVGLSDELSSDRRKEAIHKSIESAFGMFAKVASTLS
jgi:hypothetical protein